MREGNKIENYTVLQPKKRANLVFPMLILWALMVIFGLVFVWMTNDVNEGLGDYYLIPWALLAGIIILSPSIYYVYKGTFDLFHPLVYGVWSYIFPAFIGGAFIITFGWTEVYFLAYIENPTIDLPLSLTYIVLGYIGVVIGFYLPINKYFVKALNNYMPNWKWNLDDVWIPGFLLIFAGIGMNILGLLQGLLGFQRVDQIGVFDGLIVYLTTLFTVGFILLWLAVFQLKKKNAIYYLTVVVLILLIPLKMALQGSRSSLMLSIIPIAMAFWYSGRKLRWQHTVVFSGALVLAIAIGIIYGTSFRNIKGSEARMDAGDYVGQVFETVEYLGRTDSTKILSDGVRALAERIDNLSSLAVVVSNYEKLEPYEESYGLKNNIYNDLRTSFIPRLVWIDKPTTSDPRAYSDLYFNYSENSFAITPFGDLLRNYGVFGILLGMMIIGIYFRILYSYLIDTDEPRLWKKIAYFPLLTVFSYEAFYAVFFPSMLRILLVLVVSIFIANLFFRKTR